MNLRALCNSAKNRLLACEVFLKYLPVTRTLRRHGITEIRLLHFSKIHHGYFYVKGIWKNQPVFVKVDTRYHLLSNELAAYQRLHPLIPQYLVEILCYSFDTPIEFIAYPLINADHLQPGDIIHTPERFGELLQLLITLHEQQMIHRDIRYENFLVHDGQIKFIDFTFVCSPKQPDLFKTLDLQTRRGRTTLKMLGSGWKPSRYAWNDFYSLGLMLDLALDECPDAQQGALGAYTQQVKELADRPASTYELPLPKP